MQGHCSVDSRFVSVENKILYFKTFFFFFFFLNPVIKFFFFLVSYVRFI